MVQIRSNPFPTDELKRLLITDELTGLLNRRYLRFRLKEEIERARRSRRSLALLLLDMDGLKAVNDTYGHLRGDRLLVEFAAVLSSLVRPFDVVARFAGDEFVIVLPESDEKNAVNIAERICKGVADATFPGDPPLKVTTSIGIAIYPRDGKTVEELIDKADKGLYAAKRSGRNRVSFAQKGTAKTVAEVGLRKIRMVGRDEEIFLMVKALKRAMQGECNGIFVTGELGVGRSRLLSEFQMRANQAGALTLMGVCFEHTQDILYQPIRELMRRFITEQRDDAYEAMNQLNEPLRKELFRILPDLDPNLLDIDEAPTLPTAGNEEFLLYDAVSQFFKRLAERATLVIILDDIQWMDEATARLLAYLARDIIRHRVLFACGFSEGKISETRTIKLSFPNWLRNFKAIIKVTEITLHRLNSNNTKALINALLGQTMPEELVQLVFNESEGNPLFIEEILKSMMDRKILSWKDDRWVFREIQHLEAPPTIRELILNRIEELDPDDRKVLDICAVIGRVFDFDTLHQVTGLNEGHLLDVLERLEKGRFIYQRPSWEGERFQFTHNKIREVLYQGIEARKRRKIHQRTAEAIERINRNNIEMVAGELAYHYTQGKLIEKAAQLYRRAGDKAYSMHAESSALRYYTNAVKLIRDKPEKYSKELSILHQKIAIILKNQGHTSHAVKEFQTAMAIGGSSITPLRRAQIHHSIAQIYIDVKNFNAAAKEIRMARQLLDPKYDKIELIRLDIITGAILLHRGEFEACLELADNNLRFLKEPEYPVELSDYYDLKAEAEYQIGNRDVAVKLFSESLKLRRMAKDLARISRSYRNLAGIFMEASRWDHALEWFRKCLKMEETLGHVFQLAEPHARIAKILLWQGKLVDSEFHCRQAIRIREKTNDIAGLAACLTILMQNKLARGEMDKAREIIEKAEKIHSEQDIGDVGQRVMLSRAVFELKAGNPHITLALAKDLLRINEFFKNPDGEAEASLLLGQAETELGNLVIARKYIKKAENLYRELNNRFELARCFKALGILEQKAGNSGQALEMLTAAREIFSDIGAEIEKRDTLQRLSQLTGLPETP